jgi:predicted nucleic acid-binding protein
LISYLEDVEPAASAVGKLLDSFMRRENRGLISTVTVAEILVGFFRAGDSSRAAMVLERIRGLASDGFDIQEVTVEIAETAARLRAEKGGRLPDALIAATVVTREAEVLYSQDLDMQRYGNNLKISTLPV